VPRTAATDPAAVLLALDVIAELIAVKVAERLHHAGPVFAELASTWYDQNTSPIARRTYLALCRAGKVESRRVGKQVLVRREVLDAWIMKHGAPASAPSTLTSPPPAEPTDAELMEKAGFIRVAAGRVEPAPATGPRRRAGRRTR
jgi:hypothetical protein